jgi:hypothetical protein
MRMNNYPDGMDWGAYDDYYDPKLECGHRANDGCECWCEGGSGDSAHEVDDCTPSNCTLHFCECEAEKEPQDEYCVKCMGEIRGEQHE